MKLQRKSVYKSDYFALCFIVAVVAYYFLRQERTDVTDDEHDDSVKLVEAMSGGDEGPPATNIEPVPADTDQGEPSSTGSDNSHKNTNGVAVRDRHRASSTVVVTDDGNGELNKEGDENPVWEDESDGDDSLPGPVTDTVSGDSFEGDPDRNRQSSEFSPNSLVRSGEPNTADWQDEDE